MSECSESDSDPGEDTLYANEYEKIVSEQCITDLRLRGLYEAKPINTLNIDKHHFSASFKTRAS